MNEQTKEKQNFIETKKKRQKCERQNAMMTD